MVKVREAPFNTSSSNPSTSIVIGGPQGWVCYAISILQAAFSLTQVLDRPVRGRMFFKEVIRENLGFGRTDVKQLIFGRKIIRRTHNAGALPHPSHYRGSDPRVHALWHALLLFRLQPQGVRNADLRHYLAALSGRPAEQIGQGAMTY